MREDTINIAKKYSIIQQFSQNKTFTSNLSSSQRMPSSNDKAEMNKTPIVLVDTDVGLIKATSMSTSGQSISGLLKMSL